MVPEVEINQEEAKVAVVDDRPQAARTASEKLIQLISQARSGEVDRDAQKDRLAEIIVELLTTEDGTDFSELVYEATYLRYDAAESMLPADGLEEILLAKLLPILQEKISRTFSESEADNQLSDRLSVLLDSSLIRYPTLLDAVRATSDLVSKVKFDAKVSKSVKDLADSLKIRLSVISPDLDDNVDALKSIDQSIQKARQKHEITLWEDLRIRMELEATAVLWVMDMMTIDTESFAADVLSQAIKMGLIYKWTDQMKRDATEKLLQNLSDRLSQTTPVSQQLEVTIRKTIQIYFMNGMIRSINDEEFYQPAKLPTSAPTAFIEGI